VDTELLSQAVASGILIGGLYAVMSLGISLSWGALKIINLAHFSFILLGAYMTYEISTRFEVDPFLMVLFVFPVFFIAGALLQIFFEIARVDEFKSLIISFGIFIIFGSITRTIWTADFRRIDPEINPYASESITVFGISLQLPVLAAFAAAVVLAAVTTLLLSRTHFGRAVRAVVQDAEMARAFGIDPRRVAVILSGLATAYSALAGVFIAMFQALSPSMTFAWFGIVFPVVILGGLGSSWGALGAGVIVGVSAAVATVWWGPLAAPLVTFLLLIAALLVRPGGLFSRRRTV
jgi:branched-chain amino acid transport system permease protein